jgi:hypothetical protein
MGLYRVICCAVRDTDEDFRTNATRTALYNSLSLRNESRDTLICGQAVLWCGGGGSMIYIRVLKKRDLYLTIGINHMRCGK